MNKALFLKNVLDADYQVANVRVDELRFYSISTTTRVQEIEEYGRSAEHEVPEGKGGGYIWKLQSIARMEQRDGGVYIELEAIALSRDIPAAVRFMVDPIVRRISRNSLLISLHQTGEAVTARLPELAKSPPLREGREEIHGISGKSSSFTAAH